MGRKIFLLIALLTLTSGLPAEEQSSERPWDFSVEFNQMLHIQIELEYFFNNDLGMKAGFGIAPFGITCYTYNTLLVYHLNLPKEHFQLDIEAGLPLAYFDFLEGEYVDWDSTIDDPYYGFLPGIGVLASYRFDNRQTLGLRAAATMMFEHQRDSGWKDPGFMPLFAVVYNF